MSLRTIALALLADLSDGASPIDYAIGLACREKARLRVVIAAPPIVMPAMGYSGYAVATQMLMYVEQENVARKLDAESKAERLRADAAKVGVEIDVEIVSAPYDPMTPHMLRLARASDLCVIGAPAAAQPFQHDVLVDLLFGAGVPVLLIPAKPIEARALKLAVVAWDASRAAARAVHDALPLLSEAEEVEIVCVKGEKGLDELAAAELQQHLSRHCGKVSSVLAPAAHGGVAATLREHARVRGVDLLVMGAYGHSRLREFVLGGATREMLAQIETPTLMSH